MVTSSTHVIHNTSYSKHRFIHNKVLSVKHMLLQ